MKLLLYGLNYAPEPVGIGKYSGELAEWLAGRGHEVRVITAPPYFPQWRAVANRYKREQRRGVDIWRCPLWVPRRPSGVSRLIHLASFALSSLPVLLTQRKWRPDVVLTVAPAFFCATGALLLGRLCGEATTTWLHIQDFELDAAFELGILKGRWIRRLAENWERSTLQGFNNISTISEAMRQRAIVKGVKTENACLLPNWVDLKEIEPEEGIEKLNNPYRSELNISEGTLVLQYSGSMNKKQGLNILAQAIQELADMPNLLWIFAGEGPTKAELISITSCYKNVLVLPLQPPEKLNRWLNLADVHLLPQKAKAADLVLPSKLLGILASGRPVVASSPSGSELGVLAELAGIRIEPGDDKGFAKAIRQLASDRKLRERLGAKGRNIAENYFGRESILTQFESALKNLQNKSHLIRERAWKGAPLSSN
ncbi:glycosyltransferase WbuB [Synechococcus sp. CS-1331]|uniref:glycosyltransferase WbuB n=1 Tax=Synechococcus sp. CS-1331 TaxID=2847973 RepID=UPI00223B8FA9|nr:glycosyltransferase WbuB [Synechococcus sp. CS-1331]MCT0228530.1 glycosyltransferase WbuB [Synechococcus sp. CS-1331]